MLNKGEDAMMEVQHHHPICMGLMGLMLCIAVSCSSTTDGSETSALDVGSEEGQGGASSDASSTTDRVSSEDASPTEDTQPEDTDPVFEDTDEPPPTDTANPPDPEDTQPPPQDTAPPEDVDEPDPITEGCRGYATRYWDCCKAHCGWEANVHPSTEPLQSCNAANMSLGSNTNATSSCQALEPNSAYTCFNMAPWSVSETLSYGFAAVPVEGDVCGRCYQLDFDGSGHHNPTDPGASMLSTKTMIVQATNVGYDVAGRQFDLLIPGGGVGLFDACSYQWGVDTSELGATYGGFLTACQQQHNDRQARESCVLARCEAVFGAPEFAELRAACHWFVAWFHIADNPNLTYREVACPAALVERSGIDRRPLNDLQLCHDQDDPPDDTCTPQQMAECDCSWTDGGRNCGNDDGSCCYAACCNNR